MEPKSELVKCVSGHVAECWHGDSLKLGLELAQSGVKVDAVITDPPYIIKHLGGGGCFQESNRKMFNPEESGINKIREGYDIQAHMGVWTTALDAKNVVCFCSNDQVADTFNAMKEAGLSPTIMVWHKYNACPMTNNTFMPDVEYFVVGRLMGGYINNDVPTSFKSRVKRYPMVTERGWHPTPKPLSLMRELVEVLCPENGLVFEPFGGSGSTAIACLKSKRNVISVEMNDDYYPKMVDEIKAEATQNRLF